MSRIELNATPAAQYRHIGRIRDTEAEAIADAAAHLAAGAKVRIYPIQRHRRRSSELRPGFQAFALGKKIVRLTSSGVCNSHGAKSPANAAKRPADEAGLYLLRDGEWVRQ